MQQKLERHQEMVDRFRQNRMFQNNQTQFYRKLNQKGEKCDDAQPDAEESRNRDIIKESLKILGRTPNWKSPGLALVQRFG